MSELLSVAKCCDCVDGMKELSDECIDMTITSPPYDNIRTYNGYSFDYKRTLEELFRVTKQGGVVAWIVADQNVNGSETGTSFRQALYAMDVGFNLLDTMIWEKDGFTDVAGLRYRYGSVFEYIFIFCKQYPKTFNPIKDRKNIWGGHPKTGTIRTAEGNLKPVSNAGKISNEYGIRYNVWKINPLHGNDTGHPAPFPPKLVRDLMVSWSNERDTILDPFLGSGTTRKVAWEMNRNFIGFEISEEYFQKQEETCQAIMDQMRLF